MNKLPVLSNPEIEELEFEQVENVDGDAVLLYAVNTLLFLWTHSSFNVFNTVFEIFFSFLVANNITNKNKLQNNLQDASFRKFLRNRYGV